MLIDHIKVVLVKSAVKCDVDVLRVEIPMRMLSHIVLEARQGH